jgi:hypothetical protein
MKKLIILSAIAMSGLIYSTADAQIGIHLGFRFAPRKEAYVPAPVVVEQAPVYDNNDDDYYYLPDVDAYYSVSEQCYCYFDGDSWISAEYLPGAYRDYDWRSARRFEIREHAPYMHNDVYRSKYNGRAVGDWAHNSYNNHSEGNYANAGRDNNGGNRGSDQHFDNRGQGGYSQPSQPNRGQGAYTRPSDNRGQGGYSQPAQPQRGNGRNSQPSNQNGSNGRDNRGGSEHYTQNSPQGGLNSHRMTKF